MGGRPHDPGDPTPSDCGKLREDINEHYYIYDIVRSSDECQDPANEQWCQEQMDEQLGLLCEALDTACGDDDNLCDFCTSGLRTWLAQRCGPGGGGLDGDNGGGFDAENQGSPNS
jgi:hypothetical protein